MQKGTVEYEAAIDKVRIEIREEALPYFTPEEIEYYFEKNSYDINQTAYELLIIKSEDTTISLGSLSANDTSSYFKRLASRLRKRNTGNLI